MIMVVALLGVLYVGLALIPIFLSYAKEDGLVEIA
jgi:hypothetical protein